MALAPVLGSQLTGPRSLLSISGIPIAWASGIAVSEQLQHEEMRTIGSLWLTEFVPISAGWTFSCSTFALITENFYTLGVAAQQGTTAQAHLLSLLGKGNQTATVEDAKTNKLQYVMYGLKYGGASSSVSPNSMVMQDVTFYVQRVEPFGATN